MAKPKKTKRPTPVRKPERRGGEARVDAVADRDRWATSPKKPRGTATKDDPNERPRQK
jgi:hypothetical protein